MKKVLCLAAVFALSAASATFGQAMREPMVGEEGKGQIYLKPTSLQTDESSALYALILKGLDSSRYVYRVEMSDYATELEAPIKMTKSADGKKLTVTFDISGSRGSARSYSVNCLPTQMERCAADIVLRAERATREMAIDSQVR